LNVISDISLSFRPSDRNNANILTQPVGGGGSTLPQQLRNVLGGIDGTVNANFGGANAIRDVLVLLCADQTFFNAARASYLRKINAAIAHAGGAVNVPGLHLLLNKNGLGIHDAAVDANSLNVADIYCLHKLIEDLFTDGRTIQAKVVNDLFGTDARFSDTIEDGGNFYGPADDYVNFDLLFANKINIDFVTVRVNVPNNFMKNAYTDADLTLRKSLAFA